MAIDKFNSVGGFSVGIPPVEVIDGKGNITSPSGTFGELQANVANIAQLSSNSANITTANIATATIATANITQLSSDTITANKFVGGTANLSSANISGRLNAQDVYARNIYGNIQTASGQLQVNALATEILFTKVTGNSRYAIGSSDFTFNESRIDEETDQTVPAQLNVSGELNAKRVSIGTNSSGKIVQESITGATFNNSPQVLHNLASASEIEAIEYTIIATRTVDAVKTERHTCKLVASILGENIQYYEYGTAINHGVVGDFEIRFFEGAAGRFIQLVVNPAFSTGVVNYKIFSTIYKG